MEVRDLAKKVGLKWQTGKTRNKKKPEHHHSVVYFGIWTDREAKESNEKVGDPTRHALRVMSDHFAGLFSFLKANRR